MAGKIKMSWPAGIALGLGAIASVVSAKEFGGWNGAESAEALPGSSSFQRSSVLRTAGKARQSLFVSDVTCRIVSSAWRSSATPSACANARSSAAEKSVACTTD